jgi:hypothetical protein
MVHGGSQTGRNLRASAGARASWAGAGLAALLSLLAAGCLASWGQGAARAAPRRLVRVWPWQQPPRVDHAVAPQLTSARITPEPNPTDCNPRLRCPLPDWFYFNLAYPRAAGRPDRGQLLVFLPGSNGLPGNDTLFAAEAARQGYDAIVLRYDDGKELAGRSTDADPSGAADGDERVRDERGAIWNLDGQRMNGTLGVLCRAWWRQAAAFRDNPRMDACYAQARGEIAYGEGVRPDPSGAPRVGPFSWRWAGRAPEGPDPHVSRYDSIAFRLIALLDYLKARFPREGWGRYVQLKRDSPYAPGGVRQWLVLRRIILAGSSQGAGEAAYIATQFKLARVITFVNPSDNDQLTQSSYTDPPFDCGPANPTGNGGSWLAAWMRRRSATPPSRYLGFDHTHDYLYNCDAHAWRRLGYRGPRVDIDTRAPAGSHQLYTGAMRRSDLHLPVGYSVVDPYRYPGANACNTLGGDPLDPYPDAHTCPAEDSSTPILQSQTTGVFRPYFACVWDYLLSGGRRSNCAWWPRPAPRPRPA